MATESRRRCNGARPVQSGDCMTTDDPPAHESAGNGLKEPTVTLSGDRETRVEAPNRDAQARIFTPEDITGQVDVGVTVNISDGEINVGIGFLIDNRIVRIYQSGEDAMALADDIQDSVELAMEAAADD